MKPILLATNNAGKVVELRDLLPGITVLTPNDLGITMEVEETGQTYAENAALKAAAFCQASGLVTLADDSGLEVDALDGAPGLHSARYSPAPGANDADRRALLVKNLRPYPRPWKAHFHATVAVAAPVPGSMPQVQFATGDCFGEVIPEERGAGGFGYDCIFLMEGMEQTMAEISREVKNTLSHRARAVTAARPLIEALLGE